MKQIPFILDIPPLTPADEFAIFMEEGGWMIALAALLVIAAAIGIIIFTKRKRENKK